MGFGMVSVILYAWGSDSAFETAFEIQSVMVFHLESD